MLLVVAAGAQPARRRAAADAGQVAVELGREEAARRISPSRHDIDAGVLLVAEREVHGVVEDLGDVDRPELAALRRRRASDEPGRPGVRPDDARQRSRPVMPSPLRARSALAKAKARAGLSTNSSMPDVSSRPALGHPRA